MATVGQEPEKQEVAQQKSLQLKPVEVAEAESRKLAFADEDWSLEPASGTPKVAAPKSFDLPASQFKNPNLDRIDSLKFDATGQIGACCRWNPFSKFTELILIDLQNDSAKVIHRFNRPKVSVLTIAPSGKIVITKDQLTHMRPGQVDFWTLEDDKITPLAAWKTTGLSADGWKVREASHIGDDRILTNGSSITLWDTKSNTPLYSFKGFSSKVSPNGKWIAIRPGGTSMFIVDAQTGEPVGKIEHENEYFGNFAFSPNSNFIAYSLTGGGKIRVWDLEKGQCVATPSALHNSVRELRWASNDYLLIEKQGLDQHELFDWKRGVPVWLYKIPFASLIQDNLGRLWFPTTGKFLSIALPHKDLSKESAALTPEELAVFNPGTRIAMDFDLPFSEELQKSIRERWSKMILDLDMVIDDQAELKLVASVEFMEPVLASKSNEGVYKYDHTVWLKVLRGTESLWQSGLQYPARDELQTNAGESLKDAAIRLSDLDPELLQREKLPAYLRAIPPNKKLGESKITAAGIE